MTGKSEVVSVRFPPLELAEIDVHVENGAATTRSELIRSAVRRFCEGIAEAPA